MPTYVHVFQLSSFRVTSWKLLPSYSIRNHTRWRTPTGLCIYHLYQQLGDLSCCMGTRKELLSTWSENRVILANTQSIFIVIRYYVVRLFMVIIHS